jgi:hypothetical protein
MRSAVLTFASLLPAEEAKVHRNLPNVRPKNERQTLDVYAAAKGKNQPVVLW